MLLTPPLSQQIRAAIPTCRARAIPIKFPRLFQVIEQLTLLISSLHCCTQWS
ncbi:hypothetical protein Plhal703r1_c30g0118871 [Plasmopara halstedii]